jgi:acetate kinase
MILTVNSGSSSIKFTLFRAKGGLESMGVLCGGQIDDLGEEPRFVAKDSAGCQVANERLEPGASHEQALDLLLRWLEQHFPGQSLMGAGHRVVHGGAMYNAPVVLDPNVIAELERLVSLAPLHQPHNLAGIKALAKLHPNLPQVACFDTAFHYTQPRVATAFALPRTLTEAGIRRYGFHGLSYEYIASVLPDYAGSAAEGKVVAAHLGQGASMCALQARRSVATTMGFTALDGLPMGHRCGALDPGVVLYLMVEKGMDAAAVTDLLYNRSGLLGVSGISGDMRKLSESKDPHAAEAIQLFVYRIGRELGSLVAVLGGLDVLVFTGGIGEYSAAVREQVCRDAAWLGIELDSRANTAGGPCITRADSRVSAWAIRTDEDLMIARHTVKLISAANNALSAAAGPRQAPAIGVRRKY